MELSEEMLRMVDVIKKNDEKLRNENSIYKHYFAPEIPEKVMKKLLSCFDSHLAINSVVAFYDSTLFGTSKAGILFTNDGFYDRFIGKADYFAYKDISEIWIEKNFVHLGISNNEITEYIINDCWEKYTLKSVLLELIEIDKTYGQSSKKSSGKVKKLDLPEEMMSKCKKIIHVAATACGGVGTGLAQIPASDNVVIAPIQITMIVSLGKVFDLHITEAGAKGLIASCGATVTGRTISQVLVGWIPIIGNAINTATAAGLTEAIGWLAVNNFYERWIQDKNKGRFEGMVDGYEEASGEYERKLRKQADDFLRQMKDVQKERDEYEKLLDEYEKYIDELEKKCAASERVKEIRDIYSKLKDLDVA